MSASTRQEIGIEPIIHYPQQAEPGKAYLMTVDLRPVVDDLAAWPYEREEYVVNCRVQGGDLFAVEPLGEAAVVVHRFGGSYGPARFVLTARAEEGEGTIRVTLVNGWGVPLDEITLATWIGHFSGTDASGKIAAQINKTEKILERPNPDMAAVLPANELTPEHLSRSVVATDSVESIDRVWADIGKGISNNPNIARRKQWQTVDWLQASNVYHNSLEREFSWLRILSKLNPVNLEDIFVTPYLYDQLTATNHIEIDELRHQHQELQRKQYIDLWAQDRKVEQFRPLGSDFDRYPTPRAKRLNGIDLVRQGKNLQIFGKPGSGKTMFLQFLTLQALRDKSHTPIFVSLHNFAHSSANNLLQFIAEQFKVCKFPANLPFTEALLTAGKAIVLFDGLDAVKQEEGQRGEVTRLVNNFMMQYDRNQFFITCRLSASGFPFHDMNVVEIADFSTEQIHEFVSRWFSNSDMKRSAFLEGFAKPNNAGIRELCTIPLLLAMICLVFESYMRFPKHRAELYYDAIDILLRGWDIKYRNILRDEFVPVSDFGPKQIRLLFAHIAGRMFEMDKYFFEETELLGLITDYLSAIPDVPDSYKPDDYHILKELEAQNGILIERAGRIYSFSHLVFHEYFTARYIIDDGINGSIQAMLTKHITNIRWREVILLTASMISSPAPFFDSMHQSINSILYSDSTILELLTWVNHKTSRVSQSPDLLSSLRLVYLYLANVQTSEVQLDLNLINDIDASSDQSQLNFLIGRMHAIEKLIGINAESSRLDSLFSTDVLDLMANLTQLYGFDVGLDYGLGYALKLARFLGRFHYDEQVQRHSAEYVDYYEKVINLCIQNNFTPVAQNLSSLHIPDKDESQDAWVTFTERLRNVLQTERNIGYEWELTRDEAEQLNTYLRANSLYAQCLDLAYVQNRQAFLNRILAVPDLPLSEPP